MVHIFASETDHFPPIKALFELVTSVTLSIFQQGRGPAGMGISVIVNCMFLIILDFTGVQKQILAKERKKMNMRKYEETNLFHISCTTFIFPIVIVLDFLPHYLYSNSSGNESVDTENSLHPPGLVG